MDSKDSQFSECRWGWCTATFPTFGELKYHVINDHIETATPIKRRDVLMLRRTEEGIGESLSFPQHNANTSQLVNATPDHNLSMSLPSPPASSPTHGSPNLDNEEPETPHINYPPSPGANQVLPDADTSTSQPSSLIPPSPPRRVHEGLDTARQSTPAAVHSHDLHSEFTTPNFRMLSSPDASPTTHTPLLVFPSFDKRVSDALGGTTTPPSNQVFVNPSTLFQAQQSTPGESSHGSFSSTSSADFVESQLTQNSPEGHSSFNPAPPINAQVARPPITVATDANADRAQSGLRTPTSANAELSPIFPSSLKTGAAPPAHRQAWYLPPRPKQMYRSAAPSDGSPTKRFDTFRSGFVFLEPRGSAEPSQLQVQSIDSQNSLQSQPPPSSHSQRRSQEHDGSADFNVQPCSYPLQTQAAYQSQM